MESQAARSRLNRDSTLDLTSPADSLQSTCIARLAWSTRPARHAQPSPGPFRNESAANPFRAPRRWPEGGLFPPHPGPVGGQRQPRRRLAGRPRMPAPAGVRPAEAGATAAGILPLGRANLARPAPRRLLGRRDSGLESPGRLPAARPAGRANPRCRPADHQLLGQAAAATRPQPVSQHRLEGAGGRFRSRRGLSGRRPRPARSAPGRGSLGRHFAAQPWMLWASGPSATVRPRSARGGGNGSTSWASIA